jgi:branched-chain amino acid transport system ATP-binding protein
VLHCKDLCAYYKDIAALRGINLHVDRGEAVALIGVNGAGKTSLLKAISGVLAVTGAITFDGEDISHLSIEQRVRAGIAHVPEGRKIFPGLTVKENLLVGAHIRRSDGHLRSDMDRVYSLFPRLAERSTQLGWSLSGGEQQMLAIGRGLMANPSVLIVDEASLGLAPVIVKEILRIARALADDGTTVILVEQNVGALAVADVGFFVDQGVVNTTLRGDELNDGERVRRLYMG